MSRRLSTALTPSCFTRRKSAAPTLPPTRVTFHGLASDDPPHFLLAPRWRGHFCARPRSACFLLDLWRQERDTPARVAMAMDIPTTGSSRRVARRWRARRRRERECHLSAENARDTSSISHSGSSASLRSLLSDAGLRLVVAVVLTRATLSRATLAKSATNSMRQSHLTIL